MSSQSKGALRLTAAIVIAALVVSASILFAFSTYGLGGARTVTKVETTTSTVSATSAMPTQLYKVTFNETGGCTTAASPVSPFYYNMWYVTMDNITLIQPSNVTLSQINNQTVVYSQAYRMLSTIVFTVPDGNYTYYASIGGGQGGGSQGAVTVSGSDEAVQMHTGPYCP